MDKIELGATVRDEKKPAHGLRRTGFVPAELYGHNVPNMHLQLAQNEFERILRKAGESTIVTLNIEGVGTRNVLIHDVQKHAVKNQPIHIDFYEVSMSEKLTATVQIEFTGDAPAVKALGGTLVKVLNEVEVECLPGDLPHNLVVDISSLNGFDDILSVKDIPAPKGVTIISPADELVVKVQPPRDVEAELSTPVEEDVTKVEGVVKAEAEPAETKAE